MEDLSNAEKKELYEIIQICSTELLKLKNLYHLNVSEIKRSMKKKH
jgi:DNA-directed RNA polymerase alpha subunit